MKCRIDSLKPQSQLMISEALWNFEILEITARFILVKRNMRWIHRKGKGGIGVSGFEISGIIQEAPLQLTH
jgi:hypothetical protein